ncbi:hypothetical protein V500_03001 [Pseudogymnoascus sp. VKM F-4518 (FW-2643)]|nr:hypothetical protein V500_03001 [Pseudogymnoascus sp. VKM F-4518 (FW-2643)]
MSREILLVVYHQSPNTPAHWTMFIPSTDGAVQGKKIHAVGNPFQGYQLEIAEYDISKDERKYETISLGFVNDDGLSQLDTKARSIPAPGVSKNPLNRFEGDNCQSWLKRYVDLLVKDGVMAQPARDALDDAPRI